MSDSLKDIEPEFYEYDGYSYDDGRPYYPMGFGYYVEYPDGHKQLLCEYELNQTAHPGQTLRDMLNGVRHYAEW
jgi:hypothetical protein